MPRELFRATTLIPGRWSLQEPLVERPRLQDILNRHPQSNSITWMVGPIGVGKTTVSLQWAHSLNTETQYVSATTQPFTPESDLQKPDDYGTALKDLLNACSRQNQPASKEEISSYLDKVVALSQEQRRSFILDDLQQLNRESMKILLELFETALPQLQVDRALFISRTIDSTIVSGLQSVRPIRLILPETLKFDQDESAAAQQAGVFGTAPLEKVEDARIESRGWIIGMLVSLDGHGGRTLNPYVLQSTLLNDLLMDQPPAVLRILLASAKLPYNHIGIWEAWIDHFDIPYRLIPATLSQIATRTIPGSPDQFEIVPVMSDALRNIRMIAVTDDGLRDLLVIAIDWYISSKDPEAAIELARTHKLEREYLQKIKPLAVDLARTEDWEALARLVDQVPIQSIATDPDLSFWYSFALAGATRWSEIVELLYRIGDEWVSSENALIRGRHHLMKGFVARANGNYQEALNHFDDAYRALPTDAHQERMYAAASAETSKSQIRMDSDASVWQRRTAFELAHLPARQRWWHSNAGPLNLGYVAASGKTDFAYRQATQQVRSLATSYPELSWRYLVLVASIDTERMRFDFANHAIERAQSLVETPIQQQMVRIAQARLLAAQGEYEAAREKIDASPYPTGRSVNNEFRSKLELARISFDAGDASTAGLILDLSAWPADPWPRNFGDAHPELISALVIAENGATDKALDLANNVLEEAKQRGHRYLEVRSRVVLAYIHLRTGASAPHQREVQEAAELAASADYQFAFYVKGQDIRDSEEPHHVVASNIPTSPLTSRESEVLKYVAKSLSNKQIAETMFISVSTVKNHLASAYDKLGVNRRSEAVERAKSHGLI